MRASEIREHFISRADGVNRATTVDTFKFGDPDVEVRSVGVTWMLTMDAIDAAERLDVNLVITHEPTFWTHRDVIDEVCDHPAYLAKVKRLSQTGLTVMRLHDCWDWWPDVGIGASLAKLLELTLVETGEHHAMVYAARRPATLDVFARFVRDRLGMDAVRVMGDADAPVRRVGSCFGMSGGLANLRAYVDMKPDVIVAGELIDWQDVRYLQDNRLPLVLTDHAASENPGMRSLANVVAETFGVPAHFIETGPALRTTR